VHWRQNIANNGTWNLLHSPVSYYLYNMTSKDEVIDLLSSSDDESDSEEQRWQPPRQQQQNKQDESSYNEENSQHNSTVFQEVKDEPGDKCSEGKIDSLLYIRCALAEAKFPTYVRLAHHPFTMLHYKY